ncbi:MAG: 3-dehydroquinate synthase [Chitinophagaceae bacterium]|nr:3-dehydroquinate synthase [Chitinophagaceae bacterium]
MREITVRINNKNTAYYFSGSFQQLKKIVNPGYAVLITDTNVYKSQLKIFKGWNTIVLKPGEKYKVQQTVDSIISQLIRMKADRSMTLIGVGGGVITDITGYTASIYLRGVSFGFVPSSLLAMVDAAIGGKNGVNVGAYKNMVGIIRQPDFILFDVSLLKSLPVKEWRNGFAEVIKHACIADKKMFRFLEQRNPNVLMKDLAELEMLIERNVMLKTKVVKKDEFERNIRRHLNFGHTLGHALERQFDISHGEAISAGMVFDVYLSEKLMNFGDVKRILQLLKQYDLLLSFSFPLRKTMQLISGDKKKEKSFIHYVLLKNIGSAVTYPVSLQQLEKHLKLFLQKNESIRKSF